MLSALKGDVSRRIGHTKGGLNSKLHAVCDGQSRPIILCLSEGQMSDHVGAKLIYTALPDNASFLIGDKGYDSDKFRAALKAKGIAPCIPPRKGRNFPAGYNKTPYKQRHKVETCLAGSKTGGESRHVMTDVHTPFYCDLHCRYRHMVDLMSPEPSLFVVS